MASSHVYAGTARSMGATAGGIFRQAAGDNRWEHLTNGLPKDADVHAITVHPENPDVVYVGSTKGAYRSGNRGNTWERLRLPDEADIWSVCIHPKNPRIVYAGATPPGVYRSDDGGDTWRKMADPGRVVAGAVDAGQGHAAEADRGDFRSRFAEPAPLRDDHIVHRSLRSLKPPPISSPASGGGLGWGHAAKAL